MWQWNIHAKSECILYEVEEILSYRAYRSDIGYIGRTMFTIILTLFASHFISVLTFEIDCEPITVIINSVETVL